MATKAGKRPLRSLTAHEKLDAIRRVHDGESKASVARDIGVPESTLRGWCKNEDKISYLSQQSSPETDDSNPTAEPKEKRQKIDDNLQPFNLSMKPGGGGVAYSPNASELRHSQPEFDLAAKTATKAEAAMPLTKSGTHAGERDRNRAELARLSVELGLNRPEMYVPAVNATNSLADLTANIGLLAQWNNILMQQQQQQQQTQQQKNQIKKAADTSSGSPVVTSSSSAIPTTATTLIKLPELDIIQKTTPQKLPSTIEKPHSVEDSVWYWLKTQQAMLGLAQGAQGQNTTQHPQNHNNNNNNGLLTTAKTTTSTSNGTINNNGALPLNQTVQDQNSSWFWKWYKQFAYGQQPHQLLPDKPILYQQLTKDKELNSENIAAEEKPSKTNQKARAVLDNLLLHNNNNVSVNNRKEPRDEVPTQREALEHGEKFLKWLETCSEPSVTAMQIMQFRYLLTNIKNCADRKNGDSQNKTKVKRK